MTDFETVKQATDIVRYIESRGVALKKQGHLYKASCPMHAEKTPSFVVDPDKQTWRCYGACGVGGDVFEFVQQYDNVDKGEALRIVAEYARIDLSKHEDPHKRLYQLMAEATRIYHNYLFQYLGKTAEDYLKVKRGLSHQTIVDAQIGYAPDHIRDIVEPLRQKGYTQEEMVKVGLLAQSKSDKSTFYAHFRNRVMIPIRDSRGRVVAFSGRALSADEKIKYLHNTTTDIFHKSEIVHRMPFLPSQTVIETLKTLVVIEGTLDPVSALNRGFYNVVSIMGASPTDQQMDLLSKGDVKRLVFCLDKDTAGRNGLKTLAQKHVGRLASKGIELYAMFSPLGKDPDDCLREKPELWQPAVDAAKPVVNVLIDLEVSALGSNASAVQKSTLAHDLLPLLKNDNPFVEDENIRTLSAKVDIAFDRLKSWITPQIHIVDKPAPVKQDASPLPTTEEWVLHGLLMMDHEGWLQRANGRLITASDDDLPYALAPLSIADFTDTRNRRLMELILKARQENEAVGAYLDKHVDRTLEGAYQRVMGLDKIGEAFHLTFNYAVFIDRVYELRLARLRKERPTFEAKEPAKARECAIGIALLQLCQEDVFEEI